MYQKVITGTLIRVIVASGQPWKTTFTTPESTPSKVTSLTGDHEHLQVFKTVTLARDVPDSTLPAVELVKR
mgnify:CR=1 FL=1